SGSGRVQDIEIAHRTELGPEYLVATPADDQEFRTGEVAIDRDEIVAERPVETGGRGGNLHRDLLVQVDVLGRHFCKGVDIHIVDKSLNVCVEYLRRLRLGSDIGQIKGAAADQRRSELVGEHPLRVIGVYRVGSGFGRIRTKNEGVGLSTRS